MITFDEFISEFHLTEEERDELVWFLATFRMRKTLEELGYQRSRKAIMRKGEEGK